MTVSLQCKGDSQIALTGYIGFSQNLLTSMDIYRLPALSDNYIFLLRDPATQTAAVVDPAEARPVLRKLEELGAKLIAIFNTHHHSDHVGGNRELLAHFPEAVVYASEADRGRIPKQQVYLKAGDRVEFGDCTAEIYFVPGHTSGHIAYYFPPTDPTDASALGELFCGDTLFAGGCGRLFEGTPVQMVDSLGQLRRLPDETRVWCAHEYTYNNLRFALTVDEQNQALLQRFVAVKATRQRDEATVPSLLGVEKQTNPFLRWDSAELMLSTKTQDPIQSFTTLRRMKDQFH
jgi:hydroxyacylglutathione hydrolase